MNKRPGKVVVTTEVGYCSFCGRPRNLRREDHQLGALVRSIVTCETCHRTLSSTIGVASAEPAEAVVEQPVEVAKPAPPLAATSRPTAPASGEVRKPKPAAKPAPKPSVKAASKPAAKKPTAKQKAPAKAPKKPAKASVKRTTKKSTTRKK